MIYRIDANGSWEPLWETGDIVYDLAATDDGGVLVATGPEGRLYKVSRTRDVLLLTGVDAKQITRFAGPVRPGGRPSAFSTANPGRVIAVGAGGSVAGDVRLERPRHEKRRDVGPDSLGRRGRRRALLPIGEHRQTRRLVERLGRAVLASRGRADQEPDRTVSAVESGADSFGIGTGTVDVRDRRLPAAQQPADGVVGHGASTGRRVPAAVFERGWRHRGPRRSDRRSPAAARGLGSAAAPAGPPDVSEGPPDACLEGRRRRRRPAALLLQYRREGDQAWQNLRSGLTETIFVWDTTTVADGRYVIRLTASDSPSNAADRRLEGDRESDPISVDNTPPAITTEVTKSATGARLIVRVRDAQNPIQKVEYSVGGGPWQLVFPADGLADSPEERYEIPLANESDATRLVIRATDLLQNVTSQAVVDQVARGCLEPLRR